MPIPLAGKMLAATLINYFFQSPAVFEFWASLPPDNITQNAANKTDQSLSDFQTGIGAATHAIIA